VGRPQKFKAQTTCQPVCNQGFKPPAPIRCAAGEATVSRCVPEEDGSHAGTIVAVVVSTLLAIVGVIILWRRGVCSKQGRQPIALLSKAETMHQQF
jgi:hypothetical protein